ncbi:hypothetical protein [Arcobacter sp. YIC-310]|uniref:DUF7946 domain-containing protein n=1 Tax=Arcobacter sp. YIC-310 TaxID=3376632 RepID=UPI003C256C60
MSEVLTLEVSFNGALTNEHKIDLYDVSRSMMGFHRSLAITTHLLINENIITRSTSLKNAYIYTLPHESGSWKMKIIVGIGGAIGAGLIAPQNSALGHLVFSAYDYIVSESLGFHVDYNKTLGKLYSENKFQNIPIIQQHQLDMVIDKCTNSIKDMHRPIYKTESANNTIIKGFINDNKIDFTSELNIDTFNYLNEEVLLEDIRSITGVIVSFSATNYSGKIEIPEIDRPINFKLDKEIKLDANFEKLISSLKNKALKNKKVENVTMDVQVIQTKKGKIKTYIVKKIWRNSL